tara:strand:- start:13592 stop:13792 length:201 start_codon:yes stop_codon:yes gene_type:complete
MSDLYCQTAENRRLLLGCNPVSFCTLLELLVCFLPEFGAIWVDDFTVSGAVYAVLSPGNETQVPPN